MNIKVFTSIINSKDKKRNDVTIMNSYDKFKSPRMNAKIYKILPHKFFDVDYSIWIDGNVFLKRDPEEYIQLLGNYDIGVFHHPKRNNFKEEALELIKSKKDNPEIIQKQLEHYEKNVDPTQYKLGACYLIIRRHTQKINNLNEKWWSEICRWSVRDQISFPYVFRDNVKYFKRISQKNKNNNFYFKRIGHKYKK